MGGERSKVSIVGGGVIGGGWAARFLLNGWDVSVFDLEGEAERRVGEVVANARRSLPRLYDRALPFEGELSFHDDREEALSGALWVQESVPERLEIKHEVHAQIREYVSCDAVIASSTSGFKPSELNEKGGCTIVAHPFNPVYLLPLVELVGDVDMCDRAEGILRGVGMYPLRVRKEMEAHIADRLLEAVWREGLWLVKDGICTTGECDDAIRMGFGLRWGQMGLFESYRIAGGEGGMKHFLAQFGPALKWPWTKLMDVPDLSEELVDMIGEQSDAQSGCKSIRELERLRDDNLVGMIRSLKVSGSGAGGVVVAHEAMYIEEGKERLPVTVCCEVPKSWTDYNGHMNEARYGDVASKATDSFLEMIGCDADYIAGGGSYFTAESHVCFLGEVLEGERLEVTTQVLRGEGKKLHLFHCFYGSGGRGVASVETFLVHMDLVSRCSSYPSLEVAERLSEMVLSHARLVMPEGAGRRVGEK